MSKRKSSSKKTAPIYAMEGLCMGVKCYRGFAPLSILSRISMPDEYHQKDNPIGTQRDLNPKHAKEAYDYAKENRSGKDALWPEIILNIRDKSTLKILPKSLAKGPKEQHLNFVKIQIKWDQIEKSKEANKIFISRVDGNHRLYYADGHKRRKLSPLDEVYSPFCIMDHVNLEAERRIFMTINYQQKKLNVSHLLRIQDQLTSDIELWEQNRPLWITVKLHEDKTSPFYGEVHKGGKKTKGEIYVIKQKSLMDGISQMLKNFPNHTAIDRDTLLKAIINFLNAVKETWPDEWVDKRKYKLMTNTGLQALGIIGGKLMNMLQVSGTLKKETFKDKLRILTDEYKELWYVKSTMMEGKSGRAGAQKIAEDLYQLISSFSGYKIEV